MQRDFFPQRGVLAWSAADLDRGADGSVDAVLVSRHAVLRWGLLGGVECDVDVLKSFEALSFRLARIGLTISRGELYIIGEGCQQRPGI